MLVRRVGMMGYWYISGTVKKNRGEKVDVVKIDMGERS